MSSGFFFSQASFVIFSTKIIGNLGKFQCLDSVNSTNFSNCFGKICHIFDITKLERKRPDQFCAFRPLRSTLDLLKKLKK